MASLNLNLTLFSFLLFSFSTSTVTAISSHATLNPLNPFEVLYLLVMLMMEDVADIVCSFINCGQGTCKASNNSLLGFDCECNPGWRKIQIGPLTFPTCLIPNCTVDFHCGNESPSAPPPPASLPPPANQISRYFGADCQGLGLDLPLGRPQPPPPPPPPGSLTSDGNGFHLINAS
ncbi:hypothetical protein CRYUN_Cryun31cG0094600 [Craigia yunnanensis]